MDPHTTSELASGMAHDSHICCKNFEFISIKGLAPAFARGYDPNLCHGDPKHVAHNEHTLGTVSHGSILEFTYPKGLVASLTASHGQASYSRNQRSMARNKLA